jgi:5'-nucleotidase
VPTTDEQGRAAVTFTIPDGVSGAQTLTISGPGGTSIGYPITVAAAAPDVATRISARADQPLSLTGKKVGYSIRVFTADGSEAVGEVIIRDGSRVLTTVTLEPGDHGRVHLTLPKLSRGLHILRATFSGDGFADSTSHPSVVIVLRK